MQEDDDDFGVTSEDTEILNLPLYIERKADGIYRYRRRVPKALRGRRIAEECRAFTSCRPLACGIRVGRELRLNL